MATFITTEDGDLLNLDHIQVISQTKIDAEGEQRIEANTCGRRSAHVLFKGAPDEVERFAARLRVLIGGHVIDTARAAEQISSARMDEQERTTTPGHPVLDESFFDQGRL